MPARARTPRRLGQRAACSADTPRRRSSSSTLFSSMAYRLANDCAGDRARHRPAARSPARAWSSRSRSSGDPPVTVDRTWTRQAADRIRRRSARTLVTPVAVGALAPRGGDAHDLRHRPDHRRARQAVARPQLRPAAGQPRHRVDRPLQVRQAPDLSRLPHHARRASCSRTRPPGTSSCSPPPTSR